MAAIETCAVLCIVNDSVLGTPVEGAKVEATLSSFEVDDGYVTPHKASAVTDATGACTLHLWPNQLGAVESNYIIKITSLGKTLKTFAVIPNQPTCNLWEVAELPPYDGLNDGSLIIGQVLAARDAAIAARDVSVAKAGEALTSAASAAGSAGAAAGSATAANTSASTASTAATNAGNSATLAQNWAIKTDGPVAGGEFSAKYWAQSIAGGPVASWVGLTGVVTYNQARTALNITNVANLAPADYPVSTMQAAAIAQKVNTTTYDADMANKADLVAGKVPASQLPSFVDDVLEFANLAAFPAVGETGKIYVALDTNLIYRWSGSAYIVISASPGSTDAVAEGVSNLYFTEARVRATPLTGISFLVNAAITAADTVVSAFGKVQKQITDLIATVAGKSDTATTVTKDSGTGAASMPVGTTAQRGAGVTGKLRFNSSTGRWEGYGAAAWGSLGGAAGGGNDAIFYEGDAVMTADYQVTPGRNAIAPGPLAINAGVTLDIPAGSTLTVV